MTFALRELFFALLFSFAISSLATPLFRRIALRFRIIDKPSQPHKTHTEPIPYLGGAAIVSTCIIVSVPTFVRDSYVLINQGSFLLVLLAPVALSILGLIDDFRNLSASVRFLVQSVAASLVSLVFFSNGYLGTPSGITLIDFLLSYFWIVGITNALNLIDNLDGSAAGVVAIASIFLAAIAILENQLFLATLSAMLIGATMGFLIWNVHPARIYLGDSGALFLGSIMSVLVLRLDTGASSIFSSWVVAFLFVAVPVLDTTIVVLSRLTNGVSPFVGAQDHISHRLMNSGLSRKRTVLVIWGLTIYFCLFGTLLNFVPGTWSMYLSGAALLSWSILAIYFLNLKYPRESR